MSWAGANRPLPPEEIPHRLFDRLFGARDLGWVNRKRSILDAVAKEGALLRKGLPKEDEMRLDEHLSSIRDLERAIASLPPDYQKVTAPEEDFDMKDWPRVAKLQSDLLAYAFATGQTRVASYMLTKCQGLARFPWLGHTAARHHDYTHKDGKAPGERGEEGQRILRDICRWHVEEFAYLVAKLKSIPEGDRTLLDNTVLMYVHEHAEAGPHKTSGMIALVAGSKDKAGSGTAHQDRRHHRRSVHDAVRRRDGRRARQDADGQPPIDRNSGLTGSLPTEVGERCSAGCGIGVPVCCRAAPLLADSRRSLPQTRARHAGARRLRRTCRGPAFIRRRRPTSRPPRRSSRSRRRSDQLGRSDSRPSIPARGRCACSPMSKSIRRRRGGSWRIRRSSSASAR